MNRRVMRGYAAVGAVLLASACKGDRGVLDPETDAPPVWSQVILMDQEACGLAEDGRLYCWRGGVSDGYRMADRRFVAVSADRSSGCALESGGETYCWLAGSSLESGAEVGGDLQFVAISGGGNGGCGIARDRRTYCWNAGGWGFPLADDPGFSAVDHNGAEFGCGLTAAGQAFCFGVGWNGHLGNGTRNDTSTVPVPVETEARFRSISVGPWHTCALTDTGEAYCWGLNSGRAVGANAGCETFHPSVGPGIDYCGRPVATAPGLRFKEIRALDHATCGLVETGETYCWGSYKAAILGPVVPGGECRHPPSYPCGAEPMLASRGERFDRLSSSKGAVVCGLQRADQPLCWGMIEENGRPWPLGSFAYFEHLIDRPLVRLPEPRTSGTVMHAGRIERGS